MQEPRTWNRRGFDVTPNGYFNVLRPSGWFAASRLPGGFRYQILPFKMPAAAPPAAATGAQGSTKADPQQPAILQWANPARQGYRPVVRACCVVLAAVAAWYGLFAMLALLP